MNYEIINEKNYDIYLLKTDKFKTINISTIIINNYKKEDITKERFLSEYLLLTNNKYSNEISLNKEILELYSPTIGIHDTFSNNHLKSIDITFLNEKFTEKGMNKKSLEFCFDFVFNPNVNNDMFSENYFNITKNIIKNRLLRAKEDSQSIAFFNSFNNFTEDTPIKNDVRGNLNDLEKINNKELYNYYINRLSTGKYVIFVVGEYDEKLVLDLKEILEKNINFKKEYELINNFPITKINEPKEIIDETSFKQSILYLIYKTYNLSDYEREYVLPIFSNLLSDRLFNNVREKESLAYYATSDFLPTYNSLYMYAGISRENYSKCKDLMIKELNDIKNKEITDIEFDKAKESIISRMYSSKDVIGGISSYLIRLVLFNKKTQDEIIENTKKVTKEEVKEIVDKLYLDVSYLLGGIK
ncbi:MAG: insulinase family protein [Bacilli bacterium]|nr:insulinase family protein [Bacilli bacterium]